jgi:hypothetical protein
MQRGTTNLLLAGALIALGALAWYKPGAGEQPEGELAFPGVADAATIRVTNTAPGMSWSLERDAAGAWALTAPLRLPTDPALTDALLKDLAEARAPSRYAASALDAKAVGLDAPSLLLEITVSGPPQGGGAERYAFGGTEPINYRRYVQHGDEVLLLNDLLYFRLSQGWSSFADKHLLPKGAQIAQLELPGVTVSVDAAGKRRLVPDDPRVSADALAALLDAWTQQTAMELKALDSAQVAQATLRVTLVGVAQPIEFRVLPSAEGLRLARADLGVEYAFPSDARAALLELQRTDSALPAPTPLPEG